MPKQKGFLRIPLLLGTGIGLLCAVGIWSGALSSWRSFASDRFFVNRYPDPSIVIVSIDDASIQRLGRWPWDRSLHAELIHEIAAAHPAVIGYDVNFPEAQNDVSDAALAEAIRQAGNVILPVELTLAVDASGRPVSDPERVLLPIPSVREAAAGIGHTNVRPDDDGVVRRAPFDVRSAIPTVSATMPSFAEAVAMRAGHLPPVTSIPMDTHGLVTINFPGQPRTFPTISAMDVLNGAIEPARFAGKMVLVGATAPDLHDEQAVPTSHGTLMSGVEIHASFIDTLIGRHWLRPVPLPVQMALVFLLAVLCSILIPLLRTRWSALLVVLVWGGILVSSFFLFDHGWILDIVWPTLALAMGYVVITLERRIRAERERRELKTVFSRYVSPSVVEAIMQDPEKLKLGGERRRMTVLFSDIRGFTTLAEGMKPEELVRVLNTYLNRMTELVFTHGGVLDKYIGDAVMAFWNAPFDQADHARRGVMTALAMRDALAVLNANGDLGKGELHVGVGLNTGDMVVGNIGGQNRHDYTVIGDNVNLASRVEGLTKEYGVDILITGSTAADAGSEILKRRLDLVVVKGKTEPVPVYEAMDLASTATPERVRLAHDFEAAFDRYLARDFNAAAEACSEILSRHPNDGPAKLLLGRCRQFTASPPLEGWNGTWVYTKK